MIYKSILMNFDFRELLVSVS